ncbi:Arm DNA-binding domain-containing protein [Sphingomonas sp. GC_Shp_1]
MVLAVQPSGSKLWRIRYRYGGRQKTLHMGRC